MSALARNPAAGELTQFDPAKTRENIAPVPPSQLALRGTLSRIGWQLPEDMTKAEWEEAGEQLDRVAGSVQWWLGDWWNAFKPEWGERADFFEERDGAAYGTCRHAGATCNAFDIGRRRPNLPFSHHVEVAALDRQEAERLLDRAEAEDWSVRDLRAAVQEQRRIGTVGRIAEAAWPRGRFSVLLADPPWQYENPPMGGSNRSIENHYPTMDLEAICNLPVADLASEDAILYLWATAPKLAECFAVLDRWGFEYRTNIVWVKDKIGMGYHARNQHELLLIAKRGELPPPAVADRASSVICADRGEHSAKPEAFHELIERWYPSLPRIELFARAPRSGWSAWGNQVEGREP